jgi:hypothetical protein
MCKPRKIRRNCVPSGYVLTGTGNLWLRGPNFHDEAPWLKSDLGIKRIDPETGRKFYDLNKDPIVSPYTGKSYPRTYFESSAVSKIKEEEETEGEGSRCRGRA